MKNQEKLSKDVDYRQIYDIPGFYVGNDGSIWSFRGKFNKFPKRIRTKNNPDGTTGLIVYDKTTRKFYVDKIVYETFVGIIPQGFDCLHIDNNLQNDSLNNLSLKQNNNVMSAEVIYKDLPSFPGYKVGSDGSVWSSNGRKNNLNQWVKRKQIFYKRPGRYFVSLRKDNKLCQRTVHSLVMEAFVGPRPKGLEIAHNNGNRIDNRIDNLRYCTHQENEDDKIIHGTLMQGEKNGNSKLSIKTAFSIKFDLKYSKMKGRAIASKHNVSEGLVSCIKHEKVWKWLKVE